MITGNDLIEVIKGQQAGRKWGIRFASSGDLVEQIPQGLPYLLKCAVANDVLRIELMPQPDEITLPARTIPAPLREAPLGFTKVFLADSTMTAFCYPFQWEDCASNRMLLERGLIHSTAERAIAAAKAMVPYES